MTQTRTATAIAALLVLAACNRGPANNVVAAAPANGAATANQAAPAPSATPAASDAVRAGIAARWPVGLPVTPAQVREMIITGNASDTVVALVGREEQSRWQTVTRGIALGEPEWIAIAPQLATGVDGEGAESFYSALSETLVTSPVAAVRLIGVDGAEGYCTDNGAISDPAQQRAWFAAAIAAVGNVSEPDLQAAKNACLARLRAEAPR